MMQFISHLLIFQIIIIIISDNFHPANGAELRGGVSGGGTV
jgi:hypothetical protein